MFEKDILIEVFHYDVECNKLYIGRMEMNLSVVVAGAFFTRI